MEYRETTSTVESLKYTSREETAKTQKHKLTKITENTWQVIHERRQKEKGYLFVRWREMCGVDVYVSDFLIFCSKVQNRQGRFFIDILSALYRTLFSSLLGERSLGQTGAKDAGTHVPRPKTARGSS